MQKTSFPKKNIKILLLEGIHQVAVDTFIEHGYTNVELLPKALPEAELMEKIKNVRMVGLRSKTQLTAPVLKSAKKLMAAGCFCIGTNQVDLKTATELGIAVFNSPYSNTRSVAELVIAEIVLLMRRIPEKMFAIRDKKWLKEARGSFEVRGKTLGIIGYGHIGSQVSILAEAMGLKVLYYDVLTKLPLGNAMSVNSLDELLAKSDVVSLHVPATPETKMMMDAEAIAKMKRGSYLLNLSRGSVVEISALVKALKNGHIAGAGIDVYPEEPKSKGDEFLSPLQDLSNVILTPHIGGSTKEAQKNIGRDAAMKLVNYLDKGMTMGSHSVPELNLPTQAQTHRILHIHDNKPGVINEITTIFKAHNANISGQYLKTNNSIGYVVFDVDKSTSESELKIIKELKKVKHTIRARMLY